MNVGSDFLSHFQMTTCELSANMDKHIYCIKHGFGVGLKRVNLQTIAGQEAGSEGISWNDWVLFLAGECSQ